MTSKYFKKEGTNLEDVQEMNRALIIRLLRQMPVCSRADLAKATGLKRATITNIIGDLINWGLVKEMGIIDGDKGRRSIGITLNSGVYKVIGVRLARKYFSVGLFDISGTEYSIRTEEIDNLSDSEATLEKMKNIIEDILKQEGANNVIGIGCAIPGPFFRNEGKMALITELAGWEKISLKEELESLSGLPVYLEHDANVGALAEWWLGSNRRESGTLVYVAAGQGVGAGIVMEGKVFRGSVGVAGEIGHMSIAYDGPQCECGNNGCLTNYSSTIALMKEIEKQLPAYPGSVLKGNCTLDSVFEAIEEEDPLAVEVFAKIAKYLGFGLVNMVYAYNPDVIIIGDELARAGSRLLRICRETVEKHLSPNLFKSLSIDISSFKKDSVLIGAGALAVDNVFRRPSLIRQLTK